MFFVVFANLIFKPFQHRDSVSIYGSDLHGWSIPIDCSLVSSNKAICSSIGLHVFRNGNITASITLTADTCADYNYAFNGTHLNVKLDLFGKDITSLLYKNGIRINVKRGTVETEMNYNNESYSYPIGTFSSFWEIMQLSAGRILYGRCPIRDRMIQINKKSLYGVFKKYSNYFTTSQLNFNTVLSSSSSVSYEAVFYSSGSTYLKYISDSIYHYECRMNITNLKISSFGIMIQSDQFDCFYFDIFQNWQKPCNQFVLSDSYYLSYAIEFGTIVVNNVISILATGYTLVDINQETLSLSNSSGFYLYNLNTNAIVGKNTSTLNNINSDILISNNGLFFDSESQLQKISENTYSNVLFLGRNVFAYDVSWSFGRVDEFAVFRTEMDAKDMFCNLIGYCTILFNNQLIEIDFNAIIALQNGDDCRLTDLSKYPKSLNNQLIDKFENIQVEFTDTMGGIFSSNEFIRSKNDSIVSATFLTQQSQNITIWSTDMSDSLCTSHPIFAYQYECPNDVTIDIDTPQSSCSSVSITLNANKYFDPNLNATGIVNLVLNLPCTVIYSANYDDLYAPVPLLSTIVQNAGIPSISSFVLIEKYGRYSFTWSEYTTDCFISLTPTSSYNPYTDPLEKCVASASPKPNVLFSKDNNNQINWNSNEDEIYVFKLKAIDSNSFCSFEYEFFLNVQGTPMSLETQVLILSLSFLTMLLILVLLYMWYRKEKVKF